MPSQNQGQGQEFGNPNNPIDNMGYNGPPMGGPTADPLSSLPLLPDIDPKKKKERADPTANLTEH